MTVKETSTGLENGILKFSGVAFKFHKMHVICPHLDNQWTVYNVMQTPCSIGLQ